MSQPDLIPATAKTPFDWIASRWRNDPHLMWTGEVLFVAGWSLMWASALAITPFLPVTACVLLMVAGLAIGATAHSLRHRP